MSDRHQKQWDFLKRKFDSKQLSHAYLFSGEKNLGKKDFAKKLAELIGCKFPDLMLVAASPTGEASLAPKGREHSNHAGIPISKIREVQNFLAYKSYNGGFKIVIVDHAHLMNLEAQSCFLKTLEEPKGQTLLILISSKPGMLLPTIFSRCQEIKFLGKPAQNEAEAEEEKKILQDLLKTAPLPLSEKFKYVKQLDPDQQKLAKTLEAFQKYLRYVLFSKIGIERQIEQKYFFGLSPVLENYPVSKIKKIINLSEDISNKITFTNANPKLALEILLMEI